MKTVTWLEMQLILTMLAGGELRASTTIDATNKHASGANVGWVNWQGHVASGAVFSEYVLSGYIYSANVRRICLCDGIPGNGATPRAALYRIRRGPTSA